MSNEILEPINQEITLSPERIDHHDPAYTVNTENKPIENTKESETNHKDAQEISSSRSKKTRNSGVTPGNRMAFQRMLGTLAQVKQDLDKKTEKQLAKESMEAKLREKLFNERMESVNKQESIKTQTSEKRRKSFKKTLLKKRIELIKRAGYLKTSTLPQISYLPAKVLPKLQKIIDAQVAKVETENPPVSDIESDSDSEINSKQLNNSKTNHSNDTNSDISNFKNDKPSNLIPPGNSENDLKNNTMDVDSKNDIEK
ncbi:hypothetical protein BB559_003867 [Furculomyces boomerangus]|uniref:Pinin/SDK/MemA protein domain-containing protein n=1 Tax=Furculomyces boomerangus TaxID=61424 RepID=A0A2T9YI60_9FUNG|nr:hypothetical protein BB559_003867 [Furculomyces boomerangus]